MNNERRLRVDCGTSQTAELVRQIDAYGGFGAVSAADSPAEGSWIELEQTPGEPLVHLIDRLGTRPPPVLADAWCHQLAQLRIDLQAKQLPFHVGNIHDLRVDQAARLHIANLPLRIAESIAAAEPECLASGSLAPWLHSSATLDHSGFDLLREALEQLGQLEQLGRTSGAGGTAAAASHDAAGKQPNAVRVRPAAGGRSASKSNPARLWIAAATAAAVVVALAIFWGGRGGSDSSDLEEGTPRPMPASLPAALPVDLSDEVPVGASASAPVRSADPPRSVDPTRSPALERSRREAPGADQLAPPVMPGAELSHFAGPPVDLASNGLAAPANLPAASPRPSETALAEMESAEMASVETATSGQGAAAIEPSHRGVDLPPREQTAAMPLPALSGIPFTAAATAALQSPDGDDDWRLVWSREESETGESGGELRVIGEDSQGTTETAAVLRVDESPAEEGSREKVAAWSWAWTDGAAAMPRAEQLRNARLNIDGRHLYLRTTATAASVQLSFDQPKQQDEWSLVAAPPRRSQISITAEQIQTDEEAEGDEAGEEEAAENREPLWIRWLQTVQNEADRRVRALAEIRPSEESPVAVRVRLDVQSGRTVELETMAVATIEATAGWQPASRPGVSEAQDRVNAQQVEVEQLLGVIEQQYPTIEDRDAKALLRARREALEEQQELMAGWTERLGQLQTLLSRIAAEVRWRIELNREWPEESQMIFAAVE